MPPPPISQIPVPPKLLLPLLTIAALALAACAESRPSPHKPAIAWNPGAAPRLPLRIGPDLVIRRVQFGLLDTGPDGEDRFVPATEVPAIEGETFGWIVEVETARESLHWQEHLRLPRPPADWGDAGSDPDVLISKDGRGAVAQGEDSVEDGELSRFYWSLAAGDPAGEYELDLAIEGRPIAHFTFRVAEPVQEKAILVEDRARPRADPGVSRLAATGVESWR